MWASNWLFDDFCKNSNTRGLEKACSAFETSSNGSKCISQFESWIVRSYKVLSLYCPTLNPFSIHFPFIPNLHLELLGSSGLSEKNGVLLCLLPLSSVYVSVYVLLKIVMYTVVHFFAKLYVAFKGPESGGKWH